MRTALIAVAFALLSLPGRADAPAPPASKPKLTVNMLEARTHPDTHWYGERAYLFRAANIDAAGLKGRTITWTLDVKRKLAAWKSASSWLVVKQKVAMDKTALPDVSFGLIYRSLAKAKFQPGEHTAAFVAKDDLGNELFRSEVDFMLPAVGPNAYNPHDFH